jgi:glycosyltransferase involved in cell wall biosynthesis
MRILILTSDLYNTTGGGETVYRRLIESNLDVEFTYFRDKEPAVTWRPSNASCVPLKGARNISVAQPFFPKVCLDNLCAADMFARSVAGQRFDVVELPDYRTIGPYMKGCLKQHGVAFDAFVLAMHGTISTSLNMGWESHGVVAFDGQQLEVEQFDIADARYAISKRYIQEWQAVRNRPVHYVDPLAIVGRPPIIPWTSSGKPDLYCLGRMERRKGNDLFIELVSWLERDLYRGAFHVGSREYLGNGGSSREILEGLARSREVDIGFLPSQDRGGQDALCARDALVVLPVRYDSFNLVALEMLLRGCPVVVSNGAGVCDYLDERYPAIPYVKLDLDNFYDAVSKIRALLQDYAGYRQRLHDAIVASDLTPPDFFMRAFYESAVEKSRERLLATDFPTGPEYEEFSPSPARRLYRQAMRLAPRSVKQAAKKILRSPRWVGTALMLKLGLFNDAKLAWHAIHGLQMKRRFIKINACSENSKEAIDQKVRLIHTFGDSPVFRCNVWRELARLERLRGNELVATSYELRLMRLLGRDKHGQLPRVLRSLEQHGFEPVARACKALYADSDNSEEAVYQYLSEAYHRGLSYSAKDWQHVDDRRTSRARVAIVVSLYNAAAKLKVFLTALAQQTMARRGEIELILVDSGSPTDEYSIAKQLIADLGLNAVYVRSHQRETIQAAWNRGIQLSSAPYLVFLGVDETLYPEALDVLARELDQNSAVDWVMANSLVTEVDDRGVFKRDIMTYDRTGATKDHAYLETCYLSWVGGMYRKSIHERFGYYDETFRAAGDTEFKNRVLPRINVRFVAKTLGLFLNYPDERTTASPIAEIEDTRAWYIHRTFGGARYAFQDRDPEDALKLFYAALGYRKSYCRHISSDIEYASQLLRYVHSRGGALKLQSVISDLDRLRELMGRIEWVPHYFSRLMPGKLLVKAWREAASVEALHAKLFAGRGSPSYKLLNDNRYEQHHWMWKTDRRIGTS